MYETQSKGIGLESQGPMIGPQSAPLRTPVLSAKNHSFLSFRWIVRLSIGKINRLFKYKRDQRYLCYYSSTNNGLQTTISRGPDY